MTIDLERLRVLLAPVIEAADAYDPHELDDADDYQPPDEELFDVTFSLGDARAIRAMLR